MTQSRSCDYVFFVANHFVILFVNFVLHSLLVQNLRIMSNLIVVLKENEELFSFDEKEGND